MPPACCAPEGKARVRVRATPVLPPPPSASLPSERGAMSQWEGTGVGYASTPPVMPSAILPPAASPPRNNPVDCCAVHWTVSPSQRGALKMFHVKHRNLCSVFVCKKISTSLPSSPLLPKFLSSFLQISFPKCGGSSIIPVTEDVRGKASFLHPTKRRERICWQKT